MGVGSSVCAWCSWSGRTAISPCEPPLSRSLLTFSLSPWLVNNKKEGFGKGFPKKVDCKQAVAFRPLPPAGLYSAHFSVSSHLQSKLGGKGGVAGRSFLLHAIPSFFPVSFPHTCPAAAVIKAPSVISNAPPSPAAAPQRN